MNKVSICLLTIDRYYLTKYCIENALLNCGHDDIEFLCLDNGSKDKRIIDYMRSISDVHIEEPENIGVAKGFNKLLRHATGDYIALMDNDIALHTNWLKDFVEQNKKIGNSGISAIHCVLDKGDYKNGVYIPKDGQVFSTRFFNRSFLQDVGGFDENISMYGREDSQLCYRSSMAGYANYYLPNQTSTHLGADMLENSEYRKFKDKQMEDTFENFKQSIATIHSTRIYKRPL